MFEYYDPRKTKSMKNRLNYYRSIVFGLNKKAQLYGENGQCFEGKFILLSKCQWKFTTCTKQNVCPLYLLLSDLFVNICDIKLFNGTIRFDLFDQAKNQVNYPWKCTINVKSKLIALHNKLEDYQLSRIEELRDVECLYISPNDNNKNRIETRFINHLAIKNMKIPTFAKNIDCTIKLCVKILLQPIYNHDCNKMDDCWQTKLQFLPKSMIDIKNMVSNETDIKKLDRQSNTKDLYRNDGFIVNYYGNCKLDPKILSIIPFTIEGNGILYFKCKDVINAEYLKNNPKNTQQKTDNVIDTDIQANDNSASALIDGDRYLLNANICCEKSKIDETSMMKQIKLDVIKNKEISNNILKLRSLQCGLETTLDSTRNDVHSWQYCKGFTICDSIKRLQILAKKTNIDDFGVNGDDDSIDVFVYNRVAIFLKDVHFRYKIPNRIADVWGSRIVESLYRGQCYILISECMDKCLVLFVKVIFNVGIYYIMQHIWMIRNM